MKFNVSSETRAQLQREVRVGDVYRAKGGSHNSPYMWVVFAIWQQRTVHMVGLDRSGEVRSTTSYGIHALEGRDLIGRVEGLEEMEFNVEPMP